MYKNCVMESPGKCDSDPDEQMNEDSRKCPSEESVQLEDTEQKEDHKEGEAAVSDTPGGSSASEDSDRSTEPEETDKEKTKNKPGEVIVHEKKTKHRSILREALTRPDEDSLSSDSKKSSSEGSVQDNEQKEDHKQNEAAESSTDNRGGSSKDSDKATESEECEKKRKKVKSGKVKRNEKKEKDGSILRRALTRPDEDSDLSNDSRKSSSEESMQLENTEQKKGEVTESSLDTPKGSSKDSTQPEESDKERKKVKPGNAAPDGSILRQALTRPDEGSDLSNDSRKSASEESMQLEDTEQREGEAAGSGGLPKDSTGSEESEQDKVKPGEVTEDEKRTPDGSILRRALIRPDEGSDQSNDSKKSASEESMKLEDTEQREEEVAESGGSPKDSTESEESEQERTIVKPGEVTEGEKRAPDGSILRRALTRPDEGSDLSNDSRKSSSEKSIQLDDREQKEGEAAESGGSPKDSTESEESEQERTIVKPGEVTEDEKRAPDGSILRRALTRPDEGSDQSNDSRKSSSEESLQVEDTEQREEAAESGVDTPGVSSKDSERSTESKESEKERKSVNAGGSMEDERRPPCGSILRQALTRPEENIDNISIEVTAGDSRAPSEVPSPFEVKIGGDSSSTLPEAPSPNPTGPTGVVESSILRSALTRPDDDVDRASIEARAGGDSTRTSSEAPSPIPRSPTAAVYSSILRSALTRPEDDVDRASIEARVGDSRSISSEAPSPNPTGPTVAVYSSILRSVFIRPEDDVDRASIEARIGEESSSTYPEAPSPTPMEVRVEGDSSRTSLEAPSPITTGPTGVVDSPILRSVLTRPADDVEKASIEVIVGDSRNPSEAPSSIEETEELGLSEEARVQDLTSEGPPRPAAPPEAGQAEHLPAPTGAQAADTDPNEDSAVTTNETSIESISSTSPTSGDEIKNEGIIVQAKYILAPRLTPTSTDDTSSSEGIPDIVGNGVRYVSSSSEGEVNNEENPNVPLPRLSPQVPENIPVEENEPRTSSSSSAVSTSSHSPNSTRSSGSSTNSTSSSTEEGGSHEGGSTGNVSGRNSPNETSSTNRRPTDTRPGNPDTGSSETLPQIMEATTEEEEAAERDEPLTTTLPSSIPPASSLTGSPVSQETRTQTSPASRSTVTPARVPPMLPIIPTVTRSLTSTSTSSSPPQNPIISPDASVSVPPASSSSAANVTAPASSISAALESSPSTSTAPSVTDSSRSETGASDPPVAGSKRKITPAVKPTPSPQLSPPQLHSGSALPTPPVPPPTPAPPSLSSPPACSRSGAGSPAVASPLRSPVPKKRQRQQYQEGVPPSAAVTLSGMPCIDPNELRLDAPTPRQGTKRRTSGSDEAAVAGPSGSGHGGWRSKRSREDEDDEIPELVINPRPVLQQPVHKISDDDSGAESGDDLLRAVTPPDQDAASEDDDVIAGIIPLMPRRPPDNEDEDPKMARIQKNQETDIEIMKQNLEWLDGFGLKFVGGSDTWIVGPAVVVYDITMESPAFDDRRIMVGDQIRAIRGVQITEDMTYTQIFEFLSVIGTSQCLTIYRPDPIPYDRIVVTLKAEDTAEGDNFGLRLNSTILFSNFGSIYIEGFDESSVADLDGRLKRGDFIETINGHDMSEATHPSAAFALCSRASKEGATIVCKRFKI